MAWIAANRFLSLSEMENNALEVWRVLGGYGLPKNVVAGILGNFQSESTINPGIWQNLTIATSNGFGLGQWTPSTNYTNWATANGYDITDGDGQCRWIVEQTPVVGQWIPTRAYPLSWDEFITSDKAPGYLAWAYLRNWERPKNQNQPIRATQAEYWYAFLEGEPIPPSPIRPGGGADWFMLVLWNKAPWYAPYRGRGGGKAK